jgi:hypothetical protein
VDNTRGKRVAVDNKRNPPVPQHAPTAGSTTSRISCSAGGTAGHSLKRLVEAAQGNDAGPPLVLPDQRDCRQRHPAVESASTAPSRRPHLAS